MTRHLGFSYLLVDRFCIDQENEEEMRDQFCNMGEIFRSAACTTVAAAGDDPTYGLPGTSRPRIQQPQAKIDNCEFVSTMLPEHMIIPQTSWSGRGWTFQEERLSRRLIIFTDHQVY